jgi:hypothetical protein
MAESEKGLLDFFSTIGETDNFQYSIYSDSANLEVSTLDSDLHLTENHVDWFGAG